MKEIHYHSTIEVQPKEQRRLQEILDIKEGYAEDFGEDEVIEVYSTTFDTDFGSFGVDIKVCNGDTPYVDPVLFEVRKNDSEESWFELYPLDVEDELLGERIFEYEVNDSTKLLLHVNVIVAN